MLSANVCHVVDAEDHVYCAVCRKKEGVDFVLCDACDGGMHRQCAQLEQVPGGFWACITCEQQPTVESAIRQASNSMQVVSGKTPDAIAYYLTWSSWQYHQQNVTVLHIRNPSV